MVQPPPPGSNWWIPVAILTVSAVAVVAILLSKQLRGAPDPATAVTWEAACPGDLSGDFKCFERHYQTVVNSQSVEAAFTDIKDAYERSPYVGTTSWSMSSGGPRVTCSATSRRRGQGDEFLLVRLLPRRHGQSSPRSATRTSRPSSTRSAPVSARRKGTRSLTTTAPTVSGPWRHAREPARTLRRADDM